MKLMFADGSHTVIDSYSETSAEVTGVKVPAIQVMISGNKSLESIRSMFGNPDMLKSVSLYTDVNELIKTYTGYQDRFSINVYGEDTYGVVLAKTSDIQQKVAALEKTVENFSEYLAKAGKKLDLVQTSYDDISHVVNKTLEESLANLSQSVNTVGDRYAMIVDGINKMKQENLNAEDKVARAEQLLTGVREGISEYTNTAREIFNKMSDHLVVANKIQESSNTASLSAAKAAENAELIRSRLADFNNQTGEVKTQNEEISGKVKTLESESTDHDKKLVEQEKKLQEAENKAGEFETSLTELKQTVNTATDEFADTAKTVAKINEAMVDLIPETDITKMSLEDAKAYRISESNVALSEFLESHPIVSSCHGEEARYSITERKQQYLQAMILTTQLAAMNGTEYQPSWNATGEACTYDWTLEQLQQLAMEIESVVRPLVSRQQHIEVEIRKCTDIEQLAAVDISYSMPLANPGGE